jgi:hypothetical protein
VSKIRLSWLLQIAVALVALVVSGCNRVDRFAQAVRSVSDPEARQMVRETLWAHGSFYRWVEHNGLRCQVTIKEYRVGKTNVERQEWLLDLEKGRWRIEKPDQGVVEVFDGVALRVFKDGQLQEDLADRAGALADARLPWGILVLPFSLIEPPGCQLIYAGREESAGGGRAWNRLAVRYRPETGHLWQDRMLIFVRAEPDGYIRRRTEMIERLLLRWSDPPFNGEPVLVELGLYEWARGIAFATQWDFYPAKAPDKPGQYVRKGAARWQVQISELTLDVELKNEMFSKP